MRHPEIAEWTDYVRGVTGYGDPSVMQRHLDHGCEPCRAIVDSLTRVAEVGGTDAALAPPSEMVRSVRAIFRHPPARSFWLELRLRPPLTVSLSQRLLPAPRTTPTRGSLSSSHKSLPSS